MASIANNMVQLFCTTQVEVNGKPVTTAMIDHSDIAAGGKLEFWMADHPPPRH